MKEHNIQQQKKDQVSVQKEEKVESSLNRSVYYEEDDDDDEIIGDSYFDRQITTLPVYLDAKDTGLKTHVVHDKHESFTMHSLKEQLTVLNTKKGLGSTNPIENSAWNVFTCGKFLLTGALYNLTHIFSWTKRQRERKKAVAKSMGQVALRFGKNLLKTVGGLAVSPLITVYGAGKYIKDKYVNKERCLQGESLTHEFGKKFYAYLWGGVARNTLNTVLMGATLPLWLIAGSINTFRWMCHGEFKGFRKSFDLPTPLPPREWEDYYERFALGGAITGAFEGSAKKADKASTWSDFCFRMKTHFTRFRDANWHSFFTGDMRNYSRKVNDVVDYNNMQQI